jgi:hypothetical protein
MKFSKPKTKSKKCIVKAYSLALNQFLVSKYKNMVWFNIKKYSLIDYEFLMETYVGQD